LNQNTVKLTVILKDKNINMEKSSSQSENGSQVDAAANNSTDKKAGFFKWLKLNKHQTQGKSPQSLLEHWKNVVKNPNSVDIFTGQEANTRDIFTGAEAKTLMPKITNFDAAVILSALALFTGGKELTKSLDLPTHLSMVRHYLFDKGETVTEKEFSESEIKAMSILIDRTVSKRLEIVSWLEDCDKHGVDKLPKKSQDLYKSYKNLLLSDPYIISYDNYNKETSDFFLNKSKNPSNWISLTDEQKLSVILGSFRANPDLITGNTIQISDMYDFGINLAQGDTQNSVKNLEDLSRVSEGFQNSFYDGKMLHAAGELMPLVGQPF
jgi:hypothetical protein